MHKNNSTIFIYLQNHHPGFPTPPCHPVTGSESFSSVCILFIRGPKEFMSISNRKLEANRRNAPLSKGKMSPKGRAAVRLNACKHGLTSRETILPGEDPAEFEKLRDSLAETYAPANSLEQLLVTEIAGCYWRLLRARRVEAQLFAQCDSLVEAVTAQGDAFDRVRRYITGAERAWHKSQDDLRKAQTARHQQAKAEGGTVSQNDRDAIEDLRKFIQEGEEEMAEVLKRIPKSRLDFLNSRMPGGLSFGPTPPSSKPEPEAA